jgi:Family of unknown function (DUF5335)
MRTREVPRSEWPGFFEGVTRINQGSPVTVEVFGPEIGTQVEERELALEGLTAEVSDAGDRITIMVGAKPDDHITHNIAAPNLVSIEKTDDGVDVALAILAADGTTTLLRFRATVQREKASAVSN